MQDNSFLMQQMEWREALDDVRGDEDALARFSDELISDINARMAHLSALFSDSEQASIASHNEMIAHEIRKLTFIYKFQSQVEQYLEQLEE
jgi:molecular chaperone HscB